MLAFDSQMPSRDGLKALYTDGDGIAETFKTTANRW